MADSSAPAFCSLLRAEFRFYKSMSDRNPELDPQPGDVVTLRDNRFRRVVRRDGFNIYYVTSDSGREKCCWIVTWQGWCNRQDILAKQRGPDPLIEAYEEAL